MREARDAQSFFFQPISNVMRRRLAIHGCTERQYNFFHLALSHTREQEVDFQIFRPNAIDRRAAHP